MSLWGTEWNGTAGTVPWGSRLLVPRRKVQGLDTQLFIMC